MKVPSLEEVLAAEERLCQTGKMDKSTRDYYKTHGNHDVIMSATDMFWLDELDPDDFLNEEIDQVEIVLH